MNKFIKNWRTTASGLASIFAGIVLFTQGDKTVALTTILAGIGSIFAKDAHSQD